MLEFSLSCPSFVTVADQRPSRVTDVAARELSKGRHFESNEYDLQLFPHFLSRETQNQLLSIFSLPSQSVDVGGRRTLNQISTKREKIVDFGVLGCSTLKIFMKPALQNILLYVSPLLSDA